MLDNMGMVIFDLRPHEGCQRPKTPLGGQKWHEGVDLLKRLLKKVSQQPKQIQSDVNYNLSVESYDF